jgi:hypothetical protein
MFHDDRELVPAQAAHRVDRTGASGETIGDLLQELVADTVAHTVVDPLEVVEIDIEHSDLLLFERAQRSSACLSRSMKSRRLGSPSRRHDWPAAPIARASAR